MLFTKYKGFAFDLDGTIYVDDILIDGAAELVNRLVHSGKRVAFISNKTTGTIEDYHRILKSGGMDVTVSQIINSTMVLKKYLRKFYAGRKFFAIGEQVFIDEISKAGLTFTENPKETDILLVTLDRTFNYNKLETAAKALESGAKFFAANIDDTCPVTGGEVLDAGSTISALEKRTRKKLEKHFGKPSKYMYQEILKYMDLDESEFLIIGDRPETDIAIGNIFGIDTALVATGVKHQRFSSGIKPTYRIQSIKDIISRK